MATASCVVDFDTVHKDHVPGTSTELESFKAWLSNNKFRGHVQLFDISGWRETGHIRAPLIGPIGPQGPQGCQGPQGQLGILGFPVSHESLKKSVALEDMFLNITFKASRRYGEADAKYLQSKLFNERFPSLTVGSVTSEQIFAIPIDKHGMERSLFVSAIQPREEVYVRWKRLEESCEDNIGSFSRFATHAGALIDYMVEHNTIIDDERPVLKLNLEKAAFSGFYKVKISVLASELTVNPDLVGILKTMLLQDCCPEPGFNSFYD